MQSRKRGDTKPHHASLPEYRREFIESCVVFRSFLYPRTQLVEGKPVRVGDVVYDDLHTWPIIVEDFHSDKKGIIGRYDCELMTGAIIVRPFTCLSWQPQRKMQS